MKDYSFKYHRNMRRKYTYLALISRFNSSSFLKAGLISDYLNLSRKIPFSIMLLLILVSIEKGKFNPLFQKTSRNFTSQLNFWLHLNFKSHF